MALLLLARTALPGRIDAATVDHRLRAESAEEARLVAMVCARLDVPHCTLAVSVDVGNLQDRARKVRYAALGDWVEAQRLEGLATAHQLDDQAETLIMRLNRGSGLSGLVGIRARTGIPGCGGRLIRPLLNWRRAELAELVAASGIAGVVDPSNSDDAFDRVRIRKALAGAPWIDAEALARSAALLADADEMLAHFISRERIECVAERPEGGLRYHALRIGPPGANPLRIGVVQGIFRQLGSAIDRGAAARLIESLIAGQRGNVAGIQAMPRDFEGERVWDFETENTRRTS